MDLTKFSEYGLVGLIIGVLFFILWRMLVWVMAFVREIKSEHNEERRIWHELDVNRAKILSDLCASIHRHDEKAEERGNYNREEHKQMIETLGRINGHKQ